MPNAFARINDSQGRVLELANNYLHFNFNFGPTLISWLEEHYPFCYARIVEAARLSLESTGHSNAIAQAYNHMIMPLASFQDRLTQALWGIKDFERRFGFRPEAMWLPETAADDETLRLLVDLEMKYAILSPYQADKVRRHGSSEWEDASRGAIDTTRPYVWHDTLADGSRRKGRSLAVFFYDGELSKAAAFEGLTRDSKTFAERVSACYRHRQGPELVNMAVDGETFGHHHKFGEMTLAHSFLHELKKHNIETISYGRYLDLHPPKDEVMIQPGPDGDGTAWSCAHGVRRWKGGCDCGAEGNTTDWRLPFRAALNALRDAAAAIYSAEASKFFKAPWDARNDYAALLPDRSAEAVEEFFSRHSARTLVKTEKARALGLLEMQKNAMFMFTSCGWFFSDISRIEAVQNLRYAARVTETLHDLGFENADKPFLTLLEMAHSNYEEAVDGLRIYHDIRESSVLARQKAAALLVAGALLRGGTDEALSTEERFNIRGVLCTRGRVTAPSPEGGELFHFCCLRRDAEFPAIFFAPPSLAARLKELFSAGDPEVLLASLKAEPGFVKIDFDDFSWDEKTHYAWILSAAVRHGHSPSLVRMLEDYLYLLARLPGKTSSSWAPLRAQAAACARQAVETAFDRALHAGTAEALRALAELSGRLKAAGLECGFDPTPEEAASISRRIGGEALRSPSAASLEPLLDLLRAARALDTGDLIFHLQNYLMEIFRSAGSRRLQPDAVELLKELYSDSGILIERFNTRLEAISTGK